MPTHEWKERLIHLLEEKQGQDIQSFAVQSAFADHFVIVSALSVRHLWTLCHTLEKECKSKRIPFRCQGKTDDTSWIIFDVQDVLVHLFLEEGRAYYDLEALWHKPMAQEDAPQT
jgi:ribosome-associated protein